MLKKTITYEDFDGVQRTEDFYFNLTKSEIVEMENSVGGGLSSLLQKIIAEGDQKRLIEYFKKLVIGAYGEKSADGRVFLKNDRIREEFACTAAYSEIFMELATDDKAAAEFVNGVIPNMDKNQKTVPAMPGKAPVTASPVVPMMQPVQ